MNPTSRISIAGHMPASTGGSTLRATFAGLESAVAAAAQAYYGARLVSLVLYGSAARGTMRHDSDIDLLVIAEDLPLGRMARIREFDAVENALRPALEAARESGVESELSAVIKSPAEALAGSPLFLDMVEDARILHDTSSPSWLRSRGTCARSANWPFAVTSTSFPASSIPRPTPPRRSARRERCSQPP